MTFVRYNFWVRGLTWGLAGIFLMASLPLPAGAQEAGAPTPRQVSFPRTPRQRAVPPPVRATASAEEGEELSGGETPSRGARGEADSYEVRSIKWQDGTPLEMLLEKYTEITGRQMIKAPGLNATFPKFEGDKLTAAEQLQALDSHLAMANLALVPLGQRFYRVVQIDKAPAEGMFIQKVLPEGGHAESDALVSQLVGLKYLEMEDAVNLVQPMLHGYGKVQRFDRINSLLVTETSSNLRRIFEILELVDQPTETRVETRVYEIKHAKASDIASRLNELVSDSEKKDEVAQVAQPMAPVIRRPAGMIRARQPQPETPAAPDSAAALEAAMAERGIVQGKVKILTDERTNIIIVISRPSNFTFFDKIVAVLDRPVDPEVIVKVLALEYADAEEIAGLLNNFIGAAKSESETAGRAAAEGAAGERGETDRRARALEDYVRQRAAAQDRVRQAVGEEAAGKIGQLSPNTKILADKRTNTLLLMGTKSDIAALDEVIKKVDIMLAQVLIEAVILEVNLNNNTAYGAGWLQKSMTTYSQTMAGGVSVRKPIASWGGAFGPNTFSQVAGETVTRAFGGGSGLNYFFTFNDLNLDMVLDMVASTGEGRVLATPVILTTDNTEASIISGQQIPIRTGDTSSGGTFYSDYEYKDVAVQLKVKPRINPSRYVTLEITQSADTLGDPVDVGTGGRMYAINKREMTASISVPSRSTIVLGGLVQTDYSLSSARVPILGSIPLLGAFFRNEDKSRKRTELLVLITPYVLMSPDEARLETMRLHQASNVAAEDWYRGWSDSSLAPFSANQLQEMERKQKKEGKRRARVVAESEVEPVAVIEPAEPMPKPTPEAMDPEEFGREVERMMSQQAVEDAAEPPASSSLLPMPAEMTTSAPFTVDPAGAIVEEPGNEVEKPAKSPRRSRKNAEEPKPSMYPAQPQPETPGGVQ